MEMRGFRRWGAPPLDSRPRLREGRLCAGMTVVQGSPCGLGGRPAVSGEPHAAGAALAAVDRDHGAVDPAGPLRAEEGDDLGDFAVGAEALVRQLVLEELFKEVGMLGLEGRPASAGEVDRARRQRVDPDPVLCELPGQRRREEYFGGLGGAVLGVRAQASSRRWTRR